MKVNGSKTKVLVVSDSLTFRAGAFFEDNDGNRLANVPDDKDNRMKVLGFHLSSRPGMTAWVAALRHTFHARFWVLRHLKSFGLSEQ